MKPLRVKIKSEKGFDKIIVKDNMERLQYFRKFTYPIKAWSFNLPFINVSNGLTVYAFQNGILIPSRLSYLRIKKYSSAFIHLPKKNWFKLHKKIGYDNKTNQLAYNDVGNGIYLGKKFYDLPYFLRPFVLFHEEGHNFYLSETNADLYAIKKYLKAGGNPSDILYALEEGLTNSNLKDKRMKEAYNKLIQLK